MAQHRLQHYLRTYRRRSGFSQKEVAHLLGASFGTKVTRYERFSRRPSVITVFAYEIIFDQPVRELFAGAYESVRQDVQTRASELLEILAAESADLRTARKLQVLRAIVETKPSPSGCDQA